MRNLTISHTNICIIFDKIVQYVYINFLNCFHLFFMWGIVIHLICIHVGYSYTCSMYCGDTVIHVVCIVRYSYTCSMYCGDTVIHVICIVGYSYPCSMYYGVQLYT